MSSVTVQGPTFSDGDPSHRPTGSGFVRANEDGYLQKLAEKWMQEAGVADDDETYSLARLPAGYEVWERPRINNPNHSDKWLYGHPNHKTFDSPNRFYPHFFFLMHNGHQDCTCDKCLNHKTKIRDTMSVQKAPLLKAPFDEEGIPDKFKHLFTHLKSEALLTRKIEERASMEWQVERAVAKSAADSITQSYIPRHGEIVMYVSLAQGHELRQDASTHRFKVYKTINSGKTPKSQWVGAPTWLAGIITDNPSSTTRAVNFPQYRIEQLPTSGSVKEHHYTTLSLIRPFAFMKACLFGIPKDEWHPSIHAAIAACTTVSLIDRQDFVGNWPHAHVYSHGIFIGAESYWIGDLVRLLPESVPTDMAPAGTVPVMQIKKIQTVFHNIRAAEDAETCVEADVFESMEICFHGPVVTLSKAKTTNENTSNAEKEAEAGEAATKDV
ncbi:MAG: hypothetical protein Q9212_003384, partial [Teloschistes hypoglaucus]